MGSRGGGGGGGGGGGWGAKCINMWLDLGKKKIRLAPF